MFQDTSHYRAKTDRLSAKGFNNTDIRGNRSFTVHEVDLQEHFHRTAKWRPFFWAGLKTQRTFPPQRLHMITASLKASLKHCKTSLGTFTALFYLLERQAMRTNVPLNHGGLGLTAHLKDIALGLYLAAEQ